MKFFRNEQGFRGLIALANAKEGQPYRLYDFSGQTLVPAVATFWAKNAAVSFKTIPEDAAVVVKSGETEVAADKVHGAYDLAAGEYSYTVSCSGYQTKTGSFTVTEAEAAGHARKTIHVSLVSAGSGSGSGSKTVNVNVKVMVPPADQSKRYTYKHDSRSYTNLLTTTGQGDCDRRKLGTGCLCHRSGPGSDRLYGAVQRLLPDDRRLV